MSNKIIITEQNLRNVITETIKNILLEDAESAGIKNAINYIVKRGYSKEDAHNIFNALRNDIPSIRLPLYTNSNGKEKGTYKFAIGVTRMYLNGELSDGHTIMKLKNTLKLLAQGHSNEYDSNLNGITAKELNKRFESASISELQKDMDDVSSEQYSPNGYTVVRIPDAKTARNYGKYTSWCVTHQSDMYDSYTSDGTGLFYFFLKDGFENIPVVKGKNCPLDEYGLSMIAVSINMDGSINTVTCRWNHDNGGNDNILNAKQLSKIVGVNVYEVCKPYTRDELHKKGITPFDEVQSMLDSGVDPESIFNDIVDFYDDGLAAVELNNKWNLINADGQLLSNQWFNCIDSFNEGFAAVVLNDKENFINADGQLLSNQWFDYVNEFYNGFAKVKLNGRYNFINADGQLLSNQGFDEVSDFRNGFSRVALNHKWNFINRDGQLLFSQWFDAIVSFYDNGLAQVKLNGKWNFINTDEQLLSNQWFDDINPFYNGRADVQLNHKWNSINADGQLLFDQWVDEISDSYNGFTKVRLNDKWNLINRDGHLLSNQWFDYISRFNEGFAEVELNGKRNLINRDGHLLSNQWFDYIGLFCNDCFAAVKLNDKFNFINREGQMLFDQWFDNATPFHKGRAQVELNGKYLTINQNGEICEAIKLKSKPIINEAKLHKIINNAINNALNKQ